MTPIQYVTDLATVSIRFALAAAVVLLGFAILKEITR